VTIEIAIAFAWEPFATVLTKAKGAQLTFTALVSSVWLRVDPPREILLLGIVSSNVRTVPHSFAASSPILKLFLLLQHTTAVLEPSTQYENYNIDTVVIDVINIRCIVFHSIIGGEEERTRRREGEVRLAMSV